MAAGVDSTDVVIVGAGACGALVAARLAERGVAVTVLEAGKRYDPARDLANSEANAAKIMWTEPRVYTGGHAVVPKTGVGRRRRHADVARRDAAVPPRRLPHAIDRGRRRRLADRLRRPPPPLRAGRARVRRRRRVRAPSPPSRTRCRCRRTG